MVPYIRKSFYKHWLDGVEFAENYVLNDSEKLSKEEVENTSIDDNYYTKHEKAYNYAMKMTKRELDQAVEGMYHNLNSLQSRSGN